MRALRRRTTTSGARLLPLLTALAAPLLLTVVMLLPGMVGQQLFGAGDLIETQPPWKETSEVDSVTNICVSDTVDSRLATMVVLENQVADGDLTPLWDAGASAGMSLAGSASQGVTSPLYLLALLAPTVAVPAWIKFLELATILAGTLLWGRRIGLTTSASVLGGFLFATSGFMVMWTNWPHTRTAAFLPLLFWAVERIIQDRTVRSGLPLVLAGVGLALGGFPAVAVFGVYLAAAYALVRLIVVNRERGALRRTGAWVRPTLIAVGAGVVALCLTAFQLFPWIRSLDGSNLTYRSDYWQITIPYRQLLTTAFPESLGTCGSEALIWGGTNPIEGISYVGAGALVLCLAAVVLPSPSRRMGGVRAALLAVAILTFVATFVGGSLNYLLQMLPLMGENPLHRMRSVGGLTLAMLAAIGWDAVRMSKGSRSKLAWTGVVVAALLVGVAALWARRLAPTDVHWEQAAESVWLGLACGLAVAVAWAWRMSGLRGGHVVATTLIPAVVLVQALSFVDTFWPRTPPELLYRDTATTEYLQENLGDERIVAVRGAYWFGSGAKAEGLTSLTGHLFVPTEWRQLLLAAAPNMFAGPTVHRLMETEHLDSPVLDRFAVRYAVAGMPIRPPGVVLGGSPQGSGSSYDLTTAPASTELPAGSALRAVVVDLVAPAAVEDGARYRVEVVDPAGEVVASGTRVVRDGENGEQVVPVVAEHLEQSDQPHIVRTWVEGEGSVEVAGSDGPWAGPLVAEVNDTLTLVDAEDAQVYLRETALSRYRWASQTAACTAVADCARMMGEVPDDTALVSPDAAGDHAMEGAPARVTVVNDHDDHRVVDVDAEGAGMLVVADGFHEGWRATVDGDHVAIVKADAAMMGIPVSGGEHRVELWYEPPGSPELVVLAGVALVGTVLLYAWATLHDRRRRGAATGRASAT